MNLLTINIRKHSPKTQTLFIRIGKRRFEIEWSFFYKRINAYTGVIGSFSKKLF